jgi:alpha-1,3-rhamnosyl/mannosyltransferase
MQIGISGLATKQLDGIGTYTQNLIASLGARGHQLLTCQFKEFIFDSRVKNKDISQAPSYLSLFLPSRFALHQKLEQKIELFHSTNYFIPRLKNTPVVATLHDAFMLKNPEWSLPKMRPVKNFLLKKSAPWAQQYIAVSQAMIGDLVNYWKVKEENINVVYPGITADWFVRASEHDKSRVLKKYNLKPGFCLFVGTLQPRKNLKRIILAYQQLPPELQKQHPLVIIGKNGWRVEEVVDQIKALHHQNVVWLDSVDYNDLKSLYQCAQLMLFPSLAEGFGFPILESFASQVPLLTSNISSMSEIAVDAAYTVNPYEVDEILQGMLELLTNKEMRALYIQKGLQRAANFTWDRCAEQTYGIYQKLVT